jgi:hypothetical protein
MTPRIDYFPEIAGTLEERSAVELVELIGEKRLTGVIEAHDGPRRWEIMLRGGEISDALSTVEGEDPLESFLATSRGRYRLRQQVLLPDGAVSDRLVEKGAIGDQGPAELFRCCDGGGLTGTLRLRREGAMAEALFDAGVLTTITFDGHQEIDVDDLWNWTSGEWAILARPALDAAPNPLDSGLAFLREIEVAAADFLKYSDERDDDSDHITRPRIAKRRDQTVKVVYLETVDPYEDTVPVSSRYAETDITAVVVYQRPVRELPTPGDPLRLALAPATAKREREEARELDVEPDKRSDVPWALIIVTLVLLALIATILFVLTLEPS